MQSSSHRILWLFVLLISFCVQCHSVFGQAYRSIGRSTVLLADTTLYVWGDNSSDQLGIDDNIYGEHVSTPTVLQSPDGSGWKAVASSIFHTLAITQSGHLYGFGTSSNGSLANSNGDASEYIVLPGTATSWTHIACGYDHSLAITNDGKLWAFGSNQFGQLGLGDYDNRSMPTEVAMPTGVTTWKNVWAGAHQSFAVGSNGKLYSWGYNGNGQLGTGNTTLQLIPTVVLLPSAFGDVLVVTAGFGSAYALNTDGVLYAWGGNDAGQLGITGTTVYKPTQVPFPTGAHAFTTISSGANHLIATTANGSVYAVGSNNNGQLGEGTTTNRSTLTLVRRNGGTNVYGTGFAADDASYLLDSLGAIWGWGYNAYKQIGDTTTYVLYPRKIDTIDIESGTSSADTTCLYSDVEFRTAVVPTGTQLLKPGADDTTSSVQSIGFNFAFKGTTYNTFTVSSNGLLGLGSTPVTSSGTNNIANLNSPTLAPFWDDLVLDRYAVLMQSGGDMGNRVLQIYWYGHTKSTDPFAQNSVSFIVTLKEKTQSIEYYYDIGDTKSSASIGWSVDGKWVSFTPGQTWKQSASVANDVVDCASGVQFANTVVIDPSCTLAPAPPPPSGVTYTRLELSTTINLSSAWFSTSLEGFVVGTGGRLFYTIDGGSTWRLIVTGTVVDLTGFTIINGTWYIYGANGLVRYSTNNGSTWTTINIGVSTTITHIHFINESYGIAIGVGGVVLIWNGTNWIRQNIDVNAYVTFTSIYTHGTYIYVCGTGGNLWRYDGSVWVKIRVSIHADITSIVMIDNSFGYITGANGVICRTTDGGSTWVSLISTVDITLRDVYIVSRSIAFVVGDGGICLQTLDGGRTWVRINLNTTVNLHSITIVDGVGYIVGDGGFALKFKCEYIFTASGTQFSRALIGINSSIRSIQYINTTTGFFIDGDGHLHRTNDGGITWIEVNIASNVRVTSIQFFNNMMYVCGRNGYLAYSTDGGTTWLTIDLHINVNFTNLVLVNAAYGFLIGEAGVIYRFDGSVWTRIDLHTNVTLNHIVVSGSLVWLVGDGGLVWCFDGRTWTSINITTTVDLVDIHFIDARYGWIVGEGGIVWRTIDGGITWNRVNISVSTAINIHNICFASRWVGWVTCDAGLIYQTIDGGLTWSQIQLNTSMNLLCMFFANGIGRIGGADGHYWTMETSHLKYLNGVLVTSLNIDTTVDLHQCRFYDGYFGVVVGASGHVRVTINGGLTWLVRDYSVVQWNSITIIDSVLYAVGRNGGIYWSDDLGVQWHVFDNTSSDNFLSIALLNRGFGFAVGHGGALWQFDGATWIRVNLKTNISFTSVFVSGHVCFAVGKPGTMYRLNGTTWVEIKGGIIEDLLDADFYERDFGLIVGDGGFVWRTYDGGLSWLRLNIGMNIRITDLHIVSYNLVFAACDNGVLLWSTNGGNTWQQLTIADENLTSVEFNDGIGWVVGVSGSAYSFTFHTIDSHTFHQRHRAIVFNGVSTLVAVGDLQPTGTNSTVSMTAWINPTSFGHTMGIIGNHRFEDGVSKGYSMLVDSIGRFGFVFTKADGTITTTWSDTRIEANTWSHVCAASDGISVKLYINGTLVKDATFPVTTTMKADYQRFSIGRYTAIQTGYFNGLIDGVCIWQTNLSIEHIRRTMHRETVGIEPWLMGSWVVDESSEAALFNQVTGISSKALNGTVLGPSPTRGVGKVWSSTISSAGSYYAGGTDTRLVITDVESRVNKKGTDKIGNTTAASQNVDVIVHSIAVIDDITAPTGVGRVVPRTWIVNTYGQRMLKGSIQIVLGKNQVSLLDSEQPYRWVLYRRDGNGNGSWVKSATCVAVDSQTGSLTFPMQTWDGQFILGCLGDSKLDIPLHAVIIEHPVNQSVCAHAKATLSVFAVGTNLSYQWRKNGIAIPTANGPTYEIDDFDSSDIGLYDVIVDGQTTRSTTSMPAAITINTPLSILTQPTDTTACVGKRLQMAITTTGEGNTYQWYHNGEVLAGETADTLSIASVRSADSGSYYVLVQSPCASFAQSDTFLLRTIETPQIIEQPADTTVMVHSQMRLSVTAIGVQATYQWRHNGKEIPGANSNTLLIDSVSKADSGMYDVVVTGTCGDDTSASAIVRIVDSAVSVTEVVPFLQSRIYPQPTNNTVNIELEALPYSQRQSITNSPVQQWNCILVDVNGQEVLRMPILANQQNLDTRIVVDVSTMSSGMYSCLLVSNTNRYCLGYVTVLR